MKRYLGTILVLATLISTQTINTTYAQSQIQPAVGGAGVTIEDGPVGAVNDPAPEKSLICWGCIPPKSSCPRTPESCTKEKDCQIECNCDFTPPGHVAIDKGQCVRIYKDENTYDGCYCVQCGHNLY